MTATAAMFVNVASVLAQWTIELIPNNQQAEAVLGAARAGKMNEALERVESKLEAILAGNTGNVQLIVEWTAPTSSPTADAETEWSQFHQAGMTVARDKLINQSTADGEPNAEVLVYEALPTGSIPFRFDGEAIQTASFITIPNSLNKHLGFGVTTDQNDGLIRFRPENANLKWQFWKAKKLLPGRQSFETVALHEAMHALGFASYADNAIQPNALTTLDMFRVGDGSIPVTFDDFDTLARELRPTFEASIITLLGTTTGSYKMSRGTRVGGDGFQASHWRSYTRLTPPTPIGVMDPTANEALFNSVGAVGYSRADVEALDLIGWNVNPDGVPYSDLGGIQPIQVAGPAAMTQFEEGEAITFTWAPTDVDDYNVYVYQLENTTDETPYRYLEDFQATTWSIPSTNPLPPGEYTWHVVGDKPWGYRYSETRRFSVVPACNPDYNNDGSPDSTDILDLASDVAMGTQSFPPNSPDFNDDGSTDISDVFDLANVIAGGPCPS